MRNPLVSWEAALALEDVGLAMAELEQVLAADDADMVAGRALCHLYLRSRRIDELLPLLRRLYAGGYSPYYNYLAAFAHYIKGEISLARNQLRWSIINAMSEERSFEFARHLIAELDGEALVDQAHEYVTVRAAMERAEAMDQAGDWRGALRLMADTIIAHSTLIATYLERFFKLAARRRSAEPAATVYAHIQQEHGADTPARVHLGMAKVYEAGGEQSRALNCALAAVGAKPEWDEATSVLLRLAQQQGQQEAIRDALLAMQGENLISAGTLLALATLHADLGDWLRARDAAKGAIMLNPRLPGAQALYDATLQRSQGEDVAAVDDVEPPAPPQAAGETPDETLARATQLRRDGLAHQALDVLRPVLADNPRFGKGITFYFKTCIDTRNFQAAEQAAEAILAADPRNFFAALWMAKVYYACDLQYRSIDLARQAIEINPGVNEAYDLLLRIYREENILDEAVDTFRALQDRIRDNTRLHVVLAKAYLDLRRWPEAAEQARLALAITPTLHEAQQILRTAEASMGSDAVESPPADAPAAAPAKGPLATVFLDQARRYRELGEFEAAYTAYLKWAELETGPAAYIEIGDYCVAEGALQKAESAYRAALRADPRNETAKSRISEVMSRQALQSAFSLTDITNWLDIGLTEKGIEVFGRAVDNQAVPLGEAIDILSRIYNLGGLDTLLRYLPPATDEPAGNLTHAIISLLHRLYAGSSLPEVAADLERIVQAGADKADLLLYCGSVFGHLERWEEAVATLQEAVSLNENNGDIVLRLGVALFAVQRWDEATYYLEQIGEAYVAELIAGFEHHAPDANLNSVPPRAQYHFSEGIRQFELGDYEAAVESFSAALGQDKVLVPALHNLGLCYLRQDELTLSIHYLREAHHRNPRHMSIIWNLAVALYRDGHHQDSGRMLERAAAIGRQMRVFLTHGAIMYAAADRERALQSFMRARELGEASRLDVMVALLLHEDGREEEARQLLAQVTGTLFRRRDEPAAEAPRPLLTGSELYAEGKLSISLYQDRYDGNQLHQIFDELMALEAYDTAIEFFSDYATRMETYVTPMKLLAQVYGHQGDVERALAAWKECAERNPHDVRALVDLTNFCLENDLLDEARDALERARALAPRSRDVAGLARVVNSRVRESSASAQDVVRRGRVGRPDLSHIDIVDLSRDFYSSEDLRQIGEDLRNADETEAAYQFFQWYAQRHSRFVPAIVLFADACSDLGRPQEGVDALREAIDRAQKAKDVTREQGLQDELINFAIRNGLSQLLDELEVGVDAAADGGVTLQQVNQFHDLWREFKAGGQFEEAFQYFQRQLTHYPDHPDLLRLSGFALERRGDVEQGLGFLQRAAEVEGSDSAYVHLGKYCLKTKLYKKAVDAFSEAVARNPHNFEAERLRGSALRNLDLQRKRHQERGLPSGSDLLEKWQKLQEEGKYQEAVRVFEKDRSRFPDHRPIIEYLARAYEKVGDYRRAYEAYRDFYLFDGQEHDQAFVWIAAHAASMGLHQEAHRDRLAALQLNPFNHVLRALVDEAEGNGGGIHYVTGQLYREDLAQDICRQPTDTVAGEKLYNIFIEDGDLELAENTYRALQEIHPEEALFYEYLAYVYVALGEPQKALDEVVLARRRAPHGDHFFLARTAEEAARLLGLAPESALAEQGSPPAEAAETERGPETVGALTWLGRPLQSLAPRLLALYLDGGLPAGAADAEGENGAHAERIQEIMSATRAAQQAGNEQQVVGGLCRLASAHLALAADGRNNSDRQKGLYFELFVLLDEVPGALDGDEIVRHVADCLYRFYHIKDVERLLAAAEEMLPVLRAGEYHAPGRLAEALQALAEWGDVLVRMGDLTDRNARLEYYARANRRLQDGARLVRSGKEWRNQKALQRRMISTIYAWSYAMDRIHAGLNAAADVRLLLKETLVEAEGERFTIVLGVQNRGKNTAEKVAVTLVSTSDLRVVGRPKQTIGIVPSESTEEIAYQLELRPRAAGKTSFALEFKYEFSDLDSGAVRDNDPYLATVSLVTSQPFVPFDPPYNSGLPIQEHQADRFVGREDIIRRFAGIFSGGDMANVVLMWGVRRVGKTSILKHLLRTFKESTYIPVFVDMQQYKISSIDTGVWLWDVAREIARATTAAGISCPAPEMETYRVVPTVAFMQFVEALQEALDGRRVLLMFDEFEELFKKIEAGDFEQGTLEFLRSLMQHRANVLNFILTGADGLSVMVGAYDKAMFNMALPLKVSYLDRAAARALIVNPVAEFGVVYDETAVDRILDETSGHPYYIQYLCLKLMQLLNHEERYYVTLADVKLRIRDLVESDEGRDLFNQLWDESVTPVMRLLLSAISNLMAHDSDWVSRTALIDVLESHDVRLAPGQIRQAVNRLLEKDIVDEQTPRVGEAEFRIRVRLYYQWLRRWKALNNVVIEYQYTAM